MKTYYPIKIKDFSYQGDSVTPKKNRFFESYDEDSIGTNLQVILMKLREIKTVSDGTQN